MIPMLPAHAITDSRARTGGLQFQVMEIYLRHEAINNGVETLIDIATTPIYEMGDIGVTTPIGSPEHKLLHAVWESRSSGPMRLRVVQETGEIRGLWLIRTMRWPEVPSDGCVRMELQYAGDDGSRR